ncbi:MAG: membrane dipeptidase [bacterium]|nr:membrane dipeptidase [bacterium]MCP5071539.1 membrane dipeptidase [bacterium]
MYRRFPWASLLLWAPLLAAVACVVPTASVDPVDPASALHHESIVIDTHSDTTPRFQDPSWHFDQRHDEGHQDLPRMREGGLDVQFWSIYMGKTPGKGAAIREAVERIDAVHQLVARHPEDLALATTAADIRRIVHEGRIACLMGIEGGHIIEESLPALRTFHRLGARYMTLTHSFHTGWADSSGTTETPEPVHGGLTAFGEQVVAEMNRLGMMVDVSHVSDDTFRDVLRVTKAPVIASHSSARAVADHPRNLTDDMLRELAANRGVVMINFYPAYIDTSLVEPMRTLFARIGPELAKIREKYADDPFARSRAFRARLAKEEIPRTSLDVLLDHFDHAIRVAGPDHVGIGADWDGVPSMPFEMDDVSRLPNLTRGLLARGHSPETVRKVLGENLLRVMAEVEEVAGRPGP